MLDVNTPTARDLLRDTLMFDCYRSLLSPQQQRAFSLWLEEDYSLAEIAAELHVTRPAVLSLIRRAKQSLERYEQRLGLLASAQIRTEQLAQWEQQVRCWPEPYRVQAEAWLRQLQNLEEEGRRERV